MFQKKTKPGDSSLPGFVFFAEENGSSDAAGGQNQADEDRGGFAAPDRPAAARESE